MYPPCGAPMKVIRRLFTILAGSKGCSLAHSIYPAPTIQVRWLRRWVDSILTEVEQLSHLLEICQPKLSYLIALKLLQVDQKSETVAVTVKAIRWGTTNTLSLRPVLYVSQTQRNPERLHGDGQHYLSLEDVTYLSRFVTRMRYHRH